MSLVRALAPPLARALAGRWSAARRLRAYERGGRTPWSPGYLEAREACVAAALADADLMAAFAKGAPLPAGHGVGIDERCVEYPWLLSRLPPGPLRLLDAGSCLNHRVVLDAPILREKTLHILTLAPEGHAFHERGISYLYDDLRDLPLRDALYDAVACISTLEHVGWDNSHYTGRPVDEVPRPDDHLRAMRELSRVLKPGGSLFLTVPYGKAQTFGAFRQYDRALLDRALAAFGPASLVEERFFRYHASGWRAADADECADAEYVGWLARAAYEGMPSEVPREPDGAAAARAVACVRLVKEAPR